MIGDAHGLEDGSMMSFSCISRSSVPTSSCLANGKRLGCCLIDGWSAVSILCCVTVVWPISLLFLENTSSNSWNSLSAELFCSGTIQHFLEGRESTVEASWIGASSNFCRHTLLDCRLPTLHLSGTL
ncbi:hypothetical protein TNCV_3142431 [Trichonephila clavipes]|nr:hypothetical protein TNCV_3142431 [Trichonephila clavipes]